MKYPRIKKKSIIVFLVLVFVISIGIFTVVKANHSIQYVENFTDNTPSSISSLSSLINAGKIVFDDSTSAQDRINKLKSENISDSKISSILNKSESPDQKIDDLKQYLLQSTMNLLQ